MKEIRIFLASSFELEPDRARVGNLLRELNDEVYERKDIHLHLVKWEDLDSFYSPQGKQTEYDFQIRNCSLFIGLFWHVAGRYTVHEVEVARKNLPPENIFIFRKTAAFTPDHEGSEDEKLFLELHPEAQLGKLEADLETYLKEQNAIPYGAFPDLRKILTEQIAAYCAKVTVSEEERKRTYARNMLQIHVAASPEAEPDLARLGDLVRYLDENSKHYCRIKLIPKIPESDMFVSLCHTSAPDPMPQEIHTAIDSNPGGDGKPRLYFCMKYVPEDAKDTSLKELESELGERLKHYPDRYHQSAEMKLHFLLQLEQLKRSLGREMLAVKDGMICQQSGEEKFPLMSCENMPSLQKDPAYRELKTERKKLLAEIEKLREQDTTTEEDLSQKIYRLHQALAAIQQQIDDKRTGHLRLVRTLEELVGREQDETISEVRELVGKGMIDEALKLLPDSRSLRRDWEELKKQRHAEDLRAYEVCRLTIECLSASNLHKNQDEIRDLYELQIDIAEKGLHDAEKTVEACASYGKFLSYFAHHDEALGYFEKALALQLQISDKEDSHTSDACNNLGVCWWSKGNCDESLKFLEKALEIRLNVLPPNHPRIADSYNNIGLAWKDKGNYGKALEFLEKALAIYRQVLGEKHGDTAATYNNISLVWDGKGDYGKALEFLEKALAIYRQVLGENHCDTAATYYNIALTLCRTGNYDDALTYYEKSLEIRKQVLGEDHPHTADTYGSIGSTWDKRGDYDKALTYYEKALAIRRRVLGEGHPKTAETCYNVALVCRHKSDYDSALLYFEKAGEIWKRVLNENQPDIADAYHNAGGAWYHKGDYDKPLEFFEKALEIRRRIFGEDHPDIADCYDNIGVIWCKKGDCGKALEFFEKELEIRRRIFGEDHPSVAETKEAIQAVRQKLGEDPAGK